MFIDTGHVPEICAHERLVNYRVHIDALALPLESGCKPGSCCSPDCPYKSDVITPLLAQAVHLETRRECIRQWARVLLPPSSQQHADTPASELVKLLTTVPGIVAWIVGIMLSYYNHDPLTAERQTKALYAQKKFAETKAICEAELRCAPKDPFFLEMLQTLKQIERTQRVEDATTTSLIFNSEDDTGW